MSLRPLLGVRRDRGPRYLFITIVAFAVTVIATRVYLDLAGYPKVGGGGLHVAHLLWGGLLLVASALVIQLFVGGRALELSALAAGIGVGLFIDEVGKFITESNDYFFAPAAPIIYGAVLFLLLLWLVARRGGRPSRPEAVHAGVEAVRDLEDGRLTRAERDRVMELMRAARVDGQPTVIESSLATALTGDEADARLRPSGWIERGDADRLLRRLLSDRVERALVRVGLALSAIGALVGLLVILAADGGLLSGVAITSGPIETPTEPIWIVSLALVWVLVGLLNLVALVLSLTGRHGSGMRIARLAVLTNLVVGGLLNTYLSQVGALTGVVVQLGLLLLILDQERRSRMVAGALPSAGRLG